MRTTVVLLTLVGFAAAGGYGNKKHLRKKLSKEEFSRKYHAVREAPKTDHITELPKHFDWCNAYGTSELTCVPSWNQHIPVYCGSCYIHGTMSMVQDRIKIANRGKRVPDVVLGRQTFLNCGAVRGFGGGCDGGEEADILQYMHEYGLPDETCNPYKAVASETCDERAECQNCMMFDGDNQGHCWAIRNYTKYYVKSFHYVYGEEQMKKEILAHGPIVCGMAAPQDFCYAYQAGVWMKNREVTEDEVDHDVEVVGWGEENGVKYWHIRNSWGTYWGENGFFRLERGVNNLMIEEKCSGAVVDVHELDERLANKIVGSMYGPQKPGQPVQLYPANWNEEPHQWIDAPIVVKDPAHSSIAIGGRVFNYLDEPKNTPTKHSQKEQNALYNSQVNVALFRVPDTPTSTTWLVVVALLVVGVIASCCFIKRRKEEYEPI